MLIGKPELCLVDRGYRSNYNTLFFNAAISLNLIFYYYPIGYQGISFTGLGINCSFMLSLLWSNGLIDALIQYPTCLGIDQLRAALIDQYSECNLMSLEARRHQLAKLCSTSWDSTACGYIASIEKPSTGCEPPLVTLTQQVAELAYIFYRQELHLVSCSL